MKRMMCLLAALGVLSLVSADLTAQENGHKKIVVSHTGKVLKLDRGDPAFVMVKTDKADLNVELAPMTFIEQSRLTLAPDEEITVRGYEAMRDGRTVFVATEVTSKGNVVKFRDAEFNPLWTKPAVIEQSPALVTYTGKVRAFNRGEPALVMLETDKGEITTELAPMAFVEQNKILLNPNDMVTVRGYETIRGGKSIFVASEVTMPDRRIVRLRSEAREPLWIAAAPAATLRAEDIRDLSGAVTVIDTDDTPDGRYVTIRTDDGPRVIAVGPTRYLTKQRYVFAPGDRIVVRGWDVDRGGRRVFLAHEVRRPDNVVWRFRHPDGRVYWID